MLNCTIEVEIRREEELCASETDTEVSLQLLQHLRDAGRRIPRVLASLLIKSAG